MRATEFLVEYSILKWKEGPITVTVSDHLEKRASERAVSWKDINKIFKRIRTIKPQLEQMLNFHTFYLRDDDTGVELGCTIIELNDKERLLQINTAVAKGEPRKDAQNPVISVNANKINEAFNQPYPVKWDIGEHGDYDALAKLEDGSTLHIMFTNEGDSEWQVEFYRNNSLEVTGDGDAQKVFATVLNAMQHFIKKEQPDTLIFSASKLVLRGQKKNSRANLYNRLVARYASAWGYAQHHEDHGGEVIYRLNKIKNTPTLGTV